MAQTEEDRNQLNVPLDDLVADIRAAAAARDAHIAASETTTTTDGAESRSSESTSVVGRGVDDCYYSSGARASLWVVSVIRSRCRC